MKTSRTTVLAVVCAIVALVSLTGFTTVQPSGFLQDYHRLYHVGGVPLEQVWVHPEFDVRDYRTLYVAPVQIDPLAYRRNGAEDHAAAQRIGAAFRATVEQRLRDAQIFPFVSSDPYFATSRHQALRLELRITEVNSGRANLRTLVGFGAGATEIQIEGRVVDQKTCRTLAEFADRRLHSGGALLAGRQRSCDGEYLMGIDAKMILDGVVKLFVYLREEGPPHRQR